MDKNVSRIIEYKYVFLYHKIRKKEKFTIYDYGVNIMRVKKYHIYLDDGEYIKVVESLIHLKNNLILQGRYTDAVDDVLCKVTASKKKKVKITYM